MSTTVQVSLAEYLATDYEPECEFVDGVLEERNTGKRRHSETQSLLGWWLTERKQQYGYKVLTEQRVRVSATRVRVPDICLVDIENRDEIIQRPPLLWIEILSPEDRWGRVQVRLQDCLRFGVPMAWIIDPYSNEAWVATQKTGVLPVKDGILRCDHPALEVALREILPED